MQVYVDRCYVSLDNVNACGYNFKAEVKIWKQRDKLGHVLSAVTD